MVNRGAKCCSAAGCYNRTTKRYCTDCERKAKKARTVNAPKPKSRRVYDSKAWDVLRKKVSKRDPFCRCALKQCGHKLPCNALRQSNDPVDHIVPLSQGGKPYDESNLQGLCTPCHGVKSQVESGGFVKTVKDGTVTVVAGPPGSGKTTWVLNQMRPGDMLVDLDQLKRALFGTTKRHMSTDQLWFVLAARDAVLRKAEEGFSKHIWVVECAAKRSRRDELRQKLKAKVIVFEVPVDECLSRIAKDESREEETDWESLVRDWHRVYEASPLDERRKT